MAKASGSNDEPHHWWADVNLLIVVLLWGFNMPIMKYALQVTDCYTFNALRLTLSVISLGVVVYIRKGALIDRTPDARPIRTQWFLLVLFGMATGLGYQILFLVGMNSTSAGNTALIMTAIPIWTAVLSYFFLRERLSRFAWAGLLIAVLGVLVVTLSKPGGGGSNNSSLVGNLIISFAALCWAGGSVMSKPLMKNISPITLTFFTLAITLPFHFLIAQGWVTRLSEYWENPLLLGALIYSGVASTGIASSLWNVAIKQVGPSYAAGFQNLVPLIALAASWILIGEMPFAMQLTGGALIIAGVIVMRIRKQASSAGNSPPLKVGNQKTGG